MGALDDLRDDLPLLLALPANSPFWRRSDSAFASMRLGTGKGLDGLVAGLVEEFPLAHRAVAA
jgi:gamma-glutamyl:cysteine ligase YbdK (ATP-grasp superfamily)